MVGLGQLVHVLAVQVHAGFQTQRVTRAQARRAHALGGKVAPQLHDVSGGQDDFKAVFTGVAGAGDQRVTVQAGGNEWGQGFGGGLPGRARGPDLGAGVGALHGHHGQVAAGGDGDVEIAGLLHALHPGHVFVGGAGVDHHAPFVGGEEIDDQVVDDAALRVQHAGIQRLAGHGQLGDVVGDQALQEGEGVRAGNVDVQHVRHVEHASVLAHRVVFLKLRAVGQGHVPAAEIDHSGAGGDVFVGQRGAFEGCGHARELRDGNALPGLRNAGRDKADCACTASAESSAPLSFCLRVAPRLAGLHLRRLGCSLCPEFGAAPGLSRVLFCRIHTVKNRDGASMCGIGYLSDSGRIAPSAAAH
ncbi:hypothetical protein D3C73_854760 [compost metagenome]